jgi:hypothetical protein
MKDKLKYIPLVVLLSMATAPRVHAGFLDAPIAKMDKSEYVMMKMVINLKGYKCREVTAGFLMGETPRGHLKFLVSCVLHRFNVTVMGDDFIVTPE